VSLRRGEEKKEEEKIKNPCISGGGSRENVKRRE